ncbi:MAG TPA: glycosyltransferase family 2 protein [Acidobacteriaceae bacterium]|nr:glycosyltransferase family 2 protein [Acidobacteriaceae bacterium]
MSTVVEFSHPAEQASKPIVERSCIAVIIPTCNAQGDWASFSEGLRKQAIAPHQVLIVDSSSDDATRELAAADGFQVHRIERKDFNHGGTRQLAARLVPWAQIVVYLTQDAILATPNAIDQLVSAFHDPAVAAAYGRQLPRPGAGPIEAHARLFNYPPRSDVRDFESRHELGIKAAFLSNSFAAYRVNRLFEVGGFPTDAILSEDAIVAGRLLLAGYKTAYVADAMVYHSHSFRVGQEFRRYFDIGVCHRREAWLRDRFGKASGEGGRFVRSELQYLRRTAPGLIPYALFRTVSKAIGYQLGLHGVWLSGTWSKRFSYHRSFWDPIGGKPEVHGERSGTPTLPPSTA